jgi:hypothetical protein
MSTTVRRSYRTARLPPLVGVSGAAEILGIDKTTLYHWMEPGSGDFGPDKTRMIPPQRIGRRPVWVRHDVEIHRDQVGRRRARSRTKPPVA